MSNTETDELKKEIVRLRKIIQLLLEKYDLSDTDSSLLESEIGKNSTNSSQLGYETGKNRLYSSELEIETGKRRTASSELETETGKNRPDSSQLQSETGKNWSEGSEQEKEKDKEIIERLMKIISSTGPRSGVKRMARTLLHFSRGGNGSNPTLRHLTGMTESGVNKMIYHMKKNGFIVRTAKYQYRLTDQALEYLRQAGGV